MSGLLTAVVLVLYLCSSFLGSLQKTSHLSQQNFTLAAIFKYVKGQYICRRIRRGLREPGQKQDRCGPQKGRERASLRKTLSPFHNKNRKPSWHREGWVSCPSRCLERDVAAMIQASGDLFSRHEVELKMALSEVSSTCKESTRQETAFCLKTNEKVSVQEVLTAAS